MHVRLPRETFNTDRFMSDPDEWGLDAVMIRYTPDEVRAGNALLESAYSDFFTRRGGRRLGLTNLSIAFLGVSEMSSNSVARQAVALTGLSSVHVFQAALDDFFDVGSQVARPRSTGDRRSATRVRKAGDFWPFR
jgi:hypothetical protein